MKIIKIQKEALTPEMEVELDQKMTKKLIIKLWQYFKIQNIDFCKKEIVIIQGVIE